MEGVPHKSLMACCVIDEQSNSTVVDEKVLGYFGKTFPLLDYSIKFVLQNMEMARNGQLVAGLNVRGALQFKIIPINKAITCLNLADTTE